MIGQILAFTRISLPELMLVLLMFGFWLVLIILPIIYIVFSIRQRKEILKQVEQLTRDVRSLRQDFDKTK